MKIDKKVIYVLWLSIVATASIQKNIDELVDYYQNWIDRRIQEVQYFEYPEDARMYEAEDKVPKGKYFIYSFLFLFSYSFIT